jgi:hypothetical protein
MKSLSSAKTVTTIRRKEAFSLVELLLAVSLMSLIVFGLYSMFNETQKALRTNVKQVDVLESGRAAIELLVRDIEQATSPGLPVFQSLPVRPASPPHFMSGIMTNRIGGQSSVAIPVIQELADGSLRTNVLNETFFLTRSNLNWVAKGFFVSPSTNPVARASSGEINYGTLFRFSSPNVDFAARDLSQIFRPQRRMDTNLFSNLWEVYRRAKGDPSFAVSNVVASPLIEGVVHFKVQPMDSLGRPMNYWTNNAFGEQFNFRYPSVALVRDQAPGRSTFVSETRSAFYGDALPAYVEVEIGVLDQTTLSRVKALGNVALSKDYLNRQAGGVHLFRRMISLRTAPKLHRAP